MIRRAAGDEFLLIAQHDHALLAGELAARLGNPRFDAPDPAEPTVEAVAVHDAGWRGHDESPTLNPAGLPLDVFESPLAIAIEAWQISSDLTAGRADYTRLLVSLHVLGLSGFAAANVHTRREVFELNRFQQGQIELQEQLRRRLGLATDIPLRLGLPEGVIPTGERGIVRNHMLLQAMDRLSLAICCTDMVFRSVDGVPARPESRSVAMTFTRTGPFSARVRPWPFDAASLQFDLPARRIQAGTWPDVDAFRVAFRAAPSERVKVTVHE